MSFFYHWARSGEISFKCDSQSIFYAKQLVVHYIYQNYSYLTTVGKLKLFSVTPEFVQTFQSTVITSYNYGQEVDHLSEIFIGPNISLLLTDCRWGLIGQSTSRSWAWNGLRRQSVTYQLRNMQSIDSVFIRHSHHEWRHFPIFNWKRAFVPLVRYTGVGLVIRWPWLQLSSVLNILIFYVLWTCAVHERIECLTKSLDTHHSTQFVYLAIFTNEVIRRHCCYCLLRL